MTKWYIKEKGKGLLHIHTKLSRHFNFMKNNSKYDESKIYETYIKRQLVLCQTGTFYI